MFDFSGTLGASSDNQRFLDGFMRDLNGMGMLANKQELTLDSASDSHSASATSQKGLPDLDSFLGDLNDSIKKISSPNNKLSAEQHKQRDSFYHYLCYCLMSVFENRITQYAKDHPSAAAGFSSQAFLFLADPRRSVADASNLADKYILKSSEISEILKNLFSALTADQEAWLEKLDSRSKKIGGLVVLAGLIVFIVLMALAGGAAIPVYIGMGILLGCLSLGLASAFGVPSLYSHRKEGENAHKNQSELKGIQDKLNAFGEDLGALASQQKEQQQEEENQEDAVLQEGGNGTAASSAAIGFFSVGGGNAAAAAAAAPQHHSETIHPR